MADNMIVDQRWPPKEKNPKIFDHKPTLKQVTKMSVFLCVHRTRKIAKCLYIHSSLLSTSLSREEQIPLIIHGLVDTDSHQTRAVTALHSSQSSFPVVNFNSSNLTNS